MAGKTISQESLIAATKRYCDSVTGATFAVADDGERKGQIRIMPSGAAADNDVFVWLESGLLKCSNQDFGLGFMEYLTEAPGKAGSQEGKGIVPKTDRSSSGKALASFSVRDVQVQELTFDDIRNFLCPSASDKDTYMFLKLCQARNLNPFCNEAFLIPYKDNKTGEIKCSMVVGKEAFMRKAEANLQYRGFKAGIIVSRGEELIYREGTFQRKGDVLEGGWCEVYRVDRDQPIRSEVSLAEYDQGHGLWNHGKKATMIRKVSVLQSHREAFPGDLAGCYGSEEIDPAKEIKEA
jgi:phage recombination protein Bet